MINRNDKYLISTLPKTEQGQALMRWLQDEVSMIEGKEESGLKICDDPISEDLRFLLGSKISYKKVMEIARKFEVELQTQSRQGG